MNKFKSIQEYLEYFNNLHSQYIFEEPTFPPLNEPEPMEKPPIRLKNYLKKLNAEMEMEFQRYINERNKSVSKRIDAVMKEGVEITLETKQGKVTIELTT